MAGTRLHDELCLSGGERRRGFDDLKDMPGFEMHGLPSNE